MKRDALWEYWRHPSPENAPDTYRMGDGRTRLLIDLVAALRLPPNAAILELGCNVGRNLIGLHEAGYMDVRGIDINEEAIATIEREHPELMVLAGPIEFFLARTKQQVYDLVFTMAVLEHIHPGPVFCHIPRIARNLITIEDEHGVSPHHFPRDYGALFTTLGMREIAHLTCENVSGLGKDFVARVFKASND